MIKKKSILIACLVVACIGLSVSTTIAQKVGYLDAQTILLDMPGTKLAKSKLETLGKQLEKDIVAKEERLQKKLLDAQQKQERGELSPAQIQALEQELGKEGQELQQARTKAQQDLLAKENELMAPELEKLKKAIEDVAKEGGYSYVLDAAALLFAEEGQDLSAKVKAKLGM